MRILGQLLLCALFTSIPVIHSYVVERIVNGDLVDISEIPYQAALRRKTSAGWKHSCGAVFVTSKSVVSAAHCVISYQRDPSQLQVAVGTSQRSGGITYSVSQIYSHENYSSATVDSDIALVVVTNHITFSESVMPVQIAPSLLRIPAGTKAVVSGFGKTDYEGEASDLRLAVVDIVSRDECAQAYASIGTITEGMICAAGRNPPKDACQGDSGGPLVVSNTLIGIVSWGEGCANISYPGVYTKVSLYTTWIREKLNAIK
ncbi:unnamed protein product [Leptosia nina]|uniref:Peptidase S1 domain-containing protein n=1 Tax=Leptosia nina TaxID=320188 RepID=A0AAV1J9Q7_9NEOP